MVLLTFSLMIAATIVGMIISTNPTENFHAVGFADTIQTLAQIGGSILVRFLRGQQQQQQHVEECWLSNQAPSLPAEVLEGMGAEALCCNLNEATTKTTKTTKTTMTMLPPARSQRLPETAESNEHEASYDAWSIGVHVRNKDDDTVRFAAAPMNGTIEDENEGGSIPRVVRPEMVWISCAASRIMNGAYSTMRMMKRRRLLRTVLPLLLYSESMSQSAVAAADTTQNETAVVGADGLTTGCMLCLVLAAILGFLAGSCHASICGRRRNECAVLGKTRRRWSRGTAKKMVRWET